ncbi:MAG: T9SS type A sorting domain-containing protein [Flavobacteriaceae bacterium]|nr:T9SS type A sorting domain-containing protein [Flavobacteriaceae bacterium]
MKTRILITLSICYAISGFAQFGEQQIISTTTEKPYLSIPFDIDNDGFIDILTASEETFKLSWYRNLDGLGNFGDEFIFDGVGAYFLSVQFVDIDTDGDQDILLVGNNPRKVSWLENLDGNGNFGLEQILVEQDFMTSINTLDIDNDGDLDLVVALTNTFSGWIVWYENTDGHGTFGEEKMLLQNSNIFSKITMEDIDNDGLLDILAIDEVYSQGKIFWYKNLGNATFGPMQIIYQFAWVQSGGTNIIEFQYADVNTDGKKDIIMTSVDDNSFTNTHWLENLDNQGNFGDLQFIMDTNDQYLFYDLDNDNDNDMLLWKPNTNKVSFKENEDGLGTFSVPKTITTEVNLPRDAKAADIDGDGWLDIISASFSDNKLAWYKNNTLGISENESSQYTIYPNPTDGVLNVKSEKTFSKISVYNMLGQLVETTLENNQIDLSKAEAGVYLLKIEDVSGGFHTYKILKE